MGFDFSNVAEQKKGYLRQAGVQQNAKFIGLTYTATEAWEGMDIELETEDGKVFTERTFGPNIDKVFPKAKWEAGKQIGTETKQEAFNRVSDEIAAKVFYLAACFVDKDVLKEKIRNCNGLKELVDRVNSVISTFGTERTVNFLTIWKNSESKQRSNLIIADKVRWIEPTEFNAEGAVKPATIKLTSYQLNNNMTEKFPYNGQQAPAVAAPSTADLPF